MRCLGSQFIFFHSHFSFLRSHYSPEHVRSTCSFLFICQSNCLIVSIHNRGQSCLIKNCCFSLVILPPHLLLLLGVCVSLMHKAIYLVATVLVPVQT